MPEDRRLAAIMFTDIVGYTALMGKDETLAFHILEKNREIHQKIIEEYNVRFIKEIGDSILASFASAYDAVRCATKIILETENVPDLFLRIGIHEGDVVFKGQDVYGDGVNIASRLQQEAEEGTIYISGSVNQEIKNKPGIKTTFLEEKTLKNVHDPIRIYYIKPEKKGLITSESSASKENVPDKKSIIVLPFINMSPDPDQEYFSDGLTEEIITDLSHVHDLLVISRSSAMTFKGTKSTLKEIAGKVNVHYVLEGSVRKAGNNIRITAQLIDATHDTHLWAEKYSGTLDDVFDIQEKVSGSIVESLKIELSDSEKSNLSSKKIDDTAAYEQYLLAKYEIWKFNEESLRHAIYLLNNSLDKIGNNEYLLIALATAYFQFVNAGIDPDEKHLDKALELIDKVLAINPYSSEAHFLKGGIHEHKGEIKESFLSRKRALELDPDDPEAMIMMAFLHIIIGKTDKAKPFTKHAITIDPLNPLVHTGEWWVYLVEGKYVKMLEACHNMYNIDKENVLSIWAYGQALVYNNRIEEATRLFDVTFAKYPNDTWSLIGKALRHAMYNEKQEALKFITKKVRKAAELDHVVAWWLAQIHSIIGEKDKAINYLERATRENINYPLFSEIDPLLENIRGEKRFKDLMEKVKYRWQNFEV
jgi:TolB-like protein/Tfp pilus assembly protein PilF